MGNHTPPAPELPLGSRLRRIRQARGIDQAQMAHLMGFKASSAISKIENGRRRLTAEELSKWCHACAVSSDDVLNGTSVTVDLREASA